MASLLLLFAAGASGRSSAGPFVHLGDKLTAPPRSGDDGEFGTSVALSADGRTALVGAGRNGSDDAKGAAWVFVRSGGGWKQQGDKLVAAGGVGYSGFGRSVALSADGNTAVVGGPGDDGRGAAWVFTRSGTT